MSLPAPSQSHRIVASLPFVEALARRMAASMPNSIDIGDLVQDGVIGLIDAANRFDEDRGIKFETFAERRVRGAMIDALRKDAWPRGVRRQRRELEAAREALRRELGHEPSLADLAAKVGSDEKRLSRTIVRINTIESTSPLGGRRARRRSDAADGAAAVRAGRVRIAPTRRSRVRDRVRAAIESLPWRERKVIGLYYYGEVTMKQIGAEIGVNESRVTQLHARAIRRLRDALGPTMAPAQAASILKSTILQFLQKPVMMKAAAPTRAARGRAGGGDSLREHVARGAQQVAEPERLGEPGAAALLEEALRVGADDVAGHEDQPRGQRRRRRGDGAVERRAVEPRHLQIADRPDRKGARCTVASASSPSPARSTTNPASVSASATAAASAASSSTTSTRRPAERLQLFRRRRRRRFARAFPASPAAPRRTTRRARRDSMRMRPPCSWTIA